MNYGEILTAAWNAVWKHKSILVFGALSMLVPALIGVPVGALYLFLDADALTDFFATGVGGPLVVFGLALFSMLLALFFTGLGYAGVLKGTRMADEGAEGLSFSGLWRLAWPYAGRIIVLFLLWTVAITPLVVLPALLGVLTAGVAFLCLMPFIFLLIPFVLVAFLYSALVMAALVGDDLGIGEALRRGWALLRAHFWPLVLVMLILYMILIAISMVASLPAYILPFLLIIPAASGSLEPQAMFRTLGVLMMVITPLTALLQGLGMTYFYAAWMIVYRRLRQPAEPGPV